MLLPYPRHSDRESIAADATHVVHMTPEDRATILSSWIARWRPSWRESRPRNVVADEMRLGVNAG
jgi:hypothetical protein